MIRLPNTVRNRAIFRVLTMPEGTYNSQTWTVQPIPAIIVRSTGALMTGTVNQGALHVAWFNKWSIPDEERAELYMDTGVINGVTVDPIDLTGKAIRIQVYDDETAPNGLTSLDPAKWKTVWLGSVIQIVHQRQVGKVNPGRTTYHCAGILWRTRSWPLSRHSTSSVSQADGNPGYNVPLHGYFRKVLGNQDDTYGGGDPYGDMGGNDTLGNSFISYNLAHALPIDGSSDLTVEWYDYEVVKHALVSSRAFGEPLITVDLPTDLFGGAYSWQVNPGDTCWDLLRRICNRQRGRGSVVIEYSESSPTGTIKPILKGRPPFATDVKYKYFFNQSLIPNFDKTIAAAKYNKDGTGDAVDVDLNGDHRITEQGFTYKNRNAALFDYIEIVGEKIQVLCNLNFFGNSLVKRWSDSDQTAFGAITNIRQRIISRWKHVWRRYGIPPFSSSDIAWDYTVKAEPSSTAVHIDYRCADDGTIAPKQVSDGFAQSTQMTVRILPDLPIYEGWNYSVSPPVRFDSGDDYMPPPRMQPLLLYKADTAQTNGDPSWVNMCVSGGFNLQMDDYGMYFVHGAEEVSGFRYMATLALAPNAFKDLGLDGVTTTNGWTQANMNTIVGVELGTYVRLAYSVSGQGYNYFPRRMRMQVNGIHLWLGAPGAIWELDYLRASSDKYTPGLKFPTGDPTIIRDDRNSLAVIGALASKYYLEIHNPGEWALKDCGFLTKFANEAGDPVYYPKVGQLVGKVTYGGGKVSDDGNTVSKPAEAQLNTPITCVHYDHEQGITQWKTDYIDYDGNLQ